MFSASAARAVCRAAVPSRGLFSSVTAVPADPILGLVAAFKTDTAVSNTKPLMSLMSLSSPLTFMCTRVAFHNYNLHPQS